MSVPMLYALLNYSTNFNAVFFYRVIEEVYVYNMHNVIEFVISFAVQSRGRVASNVKILVV
jgi:hypothetical protein